MAADIRWNHGQPNSLPLYSSRTKHIRRPYLVRHKAGKAAILSSRQPADKERSNMAIPKTKKSKTGEIDTALNDNDLGESKDELSKDEVLDSFERGFRETLAGNTRPAQEFLDELDNE